MLSVFILVNKLFKNVTFLIITNNKPSFNDVDPVPDCDEVDAVTVIAFTLFFLLIFVFSLPLIIQVVLLQLYFQ